MRVRVCECVCADGVLERECVKIIMICHDPRHSHTFAYAIGRDLGRRQRRGVRIMVGVYFQWCVCHGYGWVLFLVEGVCVMVMVGV